MPSLTETDQRDRVVKALQAHGFEVDSGRFAIGRPDRPTFAVRTPDGQSAVAKVYPPSVGMATFANMEASWRSSFGGRRSPPGLPQPIAFLADAEILIMERISGRVLAESGEFDDQTFDAAVGLIADLHASDARPERRRTSRGIVRSLQRKLERVEQLSPAQAELMRQVVELLAAKRVGDSELVPSHGDCSPRNVLVGPERLVLIDWDRFQLADPCRDVAYFGIWNWLQDLLQGRVPDRRFLERAVATYCRCRPQAKLQKQLRFHLAAGLVRKAASLVELWPEQAHLAPVLLNLAVKELRCESPS